MDFKVKVVRRNVPDEELIQDVIGVATRTGRSTVTIDEYNALGSFNATTLQRRFGSWFSVLERAGLEDSRTRAGIPIEELFENLRRVWQLLARQPKYKELKKPLSKYSSGAYEDRFGSWNKALMEFESWIDSASTFGQYDNPGTDKTLEPQVQEQRPTGPRQPSERLRFAVLLRDGFTCQSCGASPIKEREVQLHLDHIIPWARGGITSKENLTTRCSRCNLGKGAAFDA